VAAKGQQARH